MVIITEVSSSDTSYDVFLSFRGVDTRLSFVDHLYNALEDANLRTFLDDNDIDAGEELRPELERAIKASGASIIVLSTNYASSRWCLDELVLILDQRLTSGQVVIPVFYHVDPTHVRNQESSIGVAMAEHIQRMEAETNLEKRSLLAKKIDRWKKALREVAHLKGKDVKGRKETEFIEEIVTNIRHRLGGNVHNTLPLLFGMEYSIQLITSWLKDGSEHVADMFTISGMGGIGKTSLARYVHGLHCHLFEKSSYIEGIGEKCLAQGKGLLDLQKQLCADILKTSKFQAHDTITYTSMIENGLNRKKVFIVLDDVDSIEQLHVLLGKRGFHPGSKIIITTKDMSLPEKYEPINSNVKSKHTKLLLEGLHDEASLQLLSHHAFMSNRPNDGYEEVSEQLMAYCKGHPLALKVLGESLCNKTVPQWEDCVIGLKEETDSRIMKALQMSFDSMQSKNDKELFKHIACFFVHKDRVFAETVLNSCGIRTTLGIRNLIDRCLLTLGPRNILTMHQLIQEMGRDIVRQESPDKPEERSRLWCHEESFYVLEHNKGTKYTKGLVLDMQKLEVDMSCGLVELETSAIWKMHNLMLLQLNFVRLSGSYKNFPKELRWLSMHGFPLKYIPLDLSMEKLVALDMSYSNIESFNVSFGNHQPPKKVTGSLLEDKSLLGSLKILDLSFCEKLHSLGGFWELPAVERIVVRKCISLIKLCESVEHCVELVHIDLSYCCKLKKLPTSIGKLKKLKTLLLDGCNIQNSSSPIPSDLKLIASSLPRSLIRLSLANSNLSDESFPMDLSFLSMLEELCLDFNPIVSMPNCVRTLPRIQKICMIDCKLLISIERPPRTLRSIAVGVSSRKFPFNSKTFVRKIKFDTEMSPLLLYGSWEGVHRSLEFDGLVKIEALAGVEEKILHSLGWTNFDFIKEWRLEIPNYGGAYNECATQMYYEFGIFSTIYKGKKMPDWISHGSKGSSISFTIPSSPYNLRGLNLCCTMTNKYVFPDRDSSMGFTCMLPLIRVSNITKNHTWIYKHCIGIIRSDDNNCLSWLSQWMFGPNEMKAGDNIIITVAQRKLYNEIQDIKKCGIGLVYDEGEKNEKEKEDVLAYYKSWNHIIGGDLSSFQLTTGEYILDNQKFIRFSKDIYSDYEPFVYYPTEFKEKEVRFEAFSQKKFDEVEFKAETT